MQPALHIVETGDDGVVRVDAATLTQVVDGYTATVSGAAAADAAEHALTLREALRRHGRSVLWSAFFSTALVMEGYDVVVTSSLLGMRQAAETYGTPGLDGRKSISAAWQSGIVNAALAGEIIGLALNGWASDRFGFRRTMLAALVAVIVGVFVQFFSTSLPVLAVGNVICGIPWGIFQTLTTAYAVEVCPLPLRQYLTSYINMCWGLGIFLSSGVARATLEIDGPWAFRALFAIQWFWPLPLFVGTLFAPESPWWLTRRGDTEGAVAALRKLTGPKQWDEDGAWQRVRLMQHTNAIERAELEGQSYLDCFRGTNARRTEICCMVWAIQFLCGQVMFTFVPLFLQRAGLSERAAFDFTFSTNSMYIVGTLISWVLMARFGRRSLYLCGIAAEGTLCAVLGVLGCLPGKRSVQLGIGSVMLLLNLTYSLSIGTVCYALVSEIPSTRLRAKTIVLARLSYNLTGLWGNILVPRMIDQHQFAWGAKSGFFWLASNVIILTWAYFRLPETRARSFGELDLLFNAKVPARKFAETQVDQFAQCEGDATPGEKAEENKAEVDAVDKAEPSH